MERLIGLMMDARLKDAYEQGFLSQLDPAKWFPFSYTEGLRYYGTNLRADDLAAALGDYWSMVLSLEEEGFSDADLEHAADVVRTDLEFELQSVGTRQDHQWSELYVAHFLEGADIGTVADRVARVDALLEEMQPEELTEHLRSIMSAGPPIIIAVGADPSEVPTVEEMRAAIEGAAPGPVPERTVEISALMELPSRSKRSPRVPWRPSTAPTSGPSPTAPPWCSCRRTSPRPRSTCRPPHRAGGRPWNPASGR